MRGKPEDGSFSYLYAHRVSVSFVCFLFVVYVSGVAFTIDYALCHGDPPNFQTYILLYLSSQARKLHLQKAGPALLFGRHGA